MTGVVEVGTKCSLCQWVRTKRSKPWQTCIDCRCVMCLKCHQAWRDPRCPSCNSKRWRQKEQERHTQAEHDRKTVKHLCCGCEQTYLRDDMKTVEEPRLCKTCDHTIQNWQVVEKRVTRKRMARPGLMEVNLGEHQPKQDGGCGYAYRDPGLNLKLGDIVMIPPTWLDRDVHHDYSNKVGTVVSTFSDYSKEVQTIVSLVRRAGG